MNEIGMHLQTRKLVLASIQGLSADDLLAIPEHFDNNILWNIGHIVCVQQSLVYRLSGLDVSNSKADWKMFAPSSSPQAWMETPDVDRILTLAKSLPRKLVEDYEDGRFKEYQTYTTVTGVTLTCVEDAIAFNNFHEGLHLGTILSIRNLL